MFFSRRRLIAALAGGTLGSLSNQSKAFAVRGRPKLIILLIAEQFRADYLDRFGNYFVAGGFRRLLEDGAWFQNCQMAASTFSCSGLATVSTGAYADLHGIVADSWYDRQQRQAISAGLDNLQGTTLSDEVLSADNRNRAYGVGGERRSIQLLAGRSRSRVFSMLTNGEYEVRGPGDPMGWFDAYRAANSPDKFRDAEWQALGASKGAPPLRVLRYESSSQESFASLYRASPFAQTAQFALAREVIGHERLGLGPGTDILTMAIESTALLGYEVGGDSPLMSELVLHLDREIESLLALLDKTLGARNYVLAFTAAHGAVREPAEPRASYAISGENVARSIQQALAVQYDLKGMRNMYVERYVYPFLYLRLDSLRRSFIDVREARVQAGRAALRVPGVIGYYTLDGDCSHTGEWLRRFRNSFHAVRSGDVMLAYAPQCVEDFGAGRGVSYGSLYNYEARVPLIFYGAPFSGDTLDYAVESVDLAPTLARATNVSWPSSAVGRVLVDALASG